MRRNSMVGKIVATVAAFRRRYAGDTLTAGMSDVADKLTQQAVQARKEKRLADAKRDWAEAVELCRLEGMKRDLVSALKGLGQIERDMGHGDAALPLYEEAVALCREAGEPLALAHTIRHLGDIHLEAGRLESAEPCYHEALTLYRRNERTAALDLANAIRPLAMLKEQKGEVKQARSLWAEAKELYAAVDVDAGVAESSRHIPNLS
jgi:tetratricopeptide (TPR) repeat protein